MEDGVRGEDELTADDLARLRARMRRWLSDNGVDPAYDAPAFEAALEKADRYASKAYGASWERTRSRDEAREVYEALFKPLFEAVFEGRRGKTP